LLKRVEVQNGGTLFLR